MKTLFAAAAILLVAVPAVAQKPLQNPFSDRLGKLDDLRRRAVLRRAILDNGQYCDRVDAAKLQGPWRNLTMWTARCNRGGDFGVFLGIDGSVQVSACTDMKQLKLPLCQLPPMPAATPVPPKRG